MNLPFTLEQFMNVFERYNQAVWPSQIVLNLLGVAAVVLAFRNTTRNGILISLILAILWLWSGIAYHVAFFSVINPAAYGAAVLFCMEALLIVAAGVLKHRLVWHPRVDAAGLAGGVLILYALVVYPVLGLLLGHAYPKSPTFGCPCPMTIFTFGMLLWTGSKVPFWLVIIPSLWAIVGLSAVLSLGMHEDLGLFVSCIVAVTILVIRDRGGAVAPQGA